MKIEIKNNRIALMGIENLKKYQISQLNFYGYNQNDANLEKITDKIQSELLKITEYFNQESIIYELHENASELIQNYVQKHHDFLLIVSKAKKIKDGFCRIDEFPDFKEFIKKLPRKLKPHQIVSALHFYILENGANFSVPGSGKTSTVLSVYEKFRLEGRCNMLFIIGPPSCFQPWKNEFYETLGRKPNSLILSGVNKEFRKSEYFRSKDNICELYLCTFNTALNDCKYIIDFLSQKGINTFLIIDEAHYIKQLGGAWASSIIEIGKYATFKGVLTGTPIPKSYKDLYNLFEFLWNDFSPLTEDDKINIIQLDKKKQIKEIRDVIHSRVNSLFYRVTKKDLGLIPPIFHDPIIVEMNEVEQNIYDSIKAKIFELNQSEYFRNEVILHKLWKGRMMRLRQAVSYPKLLLTVIEDYHENIVSNSDLLKKIEQYDILEVSSKMKALHELVIQLRREGKKVLIWSNFIGTLEYIKSYFSSIGEGVGLIYGKTPVRRDDEVLIVEEKTREDIRDEFLDMESGIDILVANPAACAESISLHKSCFHAIYYDLSYNAAQYLQSLDRIHRVGGSEIHEAHYYFIQCKNSIDQDIKKNLEEKAKNMYDLIEQNYSIFDLDLYGESDADDIEAYKRIFRHSKPS